MTLHTIDALGLKCPQPTLKITVQATKMHPGDILEVVADCPTYEDDVRKWCARSKKVLLWFRDEGGGKMRCQIKI